MRHQLASALVSEDIFRLQGTPDGGSNKNRNNAAAAPAAAKTSLLLERSHGTWNASQAVTGLHWFATCSRRRSVPERLSACKVLSQKLQNFKSVQRHVLEENCQQALHKPVQKAVRHAMCFLVCERGIVAHDRMESEAAIAFPSSSR